MARPDLTCQVEIIKLHLRILRAPVNSLKHYLRSIFEGPSSAWHTSLGNAIKTLKIEEESIPRLDIPLNAWKRAINKQVHEISFDLNLKSLRPSFHLNPLNNSYMVGKAQPYLCEALTTQARSKIHFMRLTSLGIAEFNPAWVQRGESTNCRLCSYKRESWLHLLCWCSNLNTEHRRLLHPICINKGIKSCSEASALCLSTTNTTDLARLAKFIHQIRIGLKASNECSKIPGKNTANSAAESGWGF